MRVPKRALALLVLLAACGESPSEKGDRLAREHRWQEAVAAYEQAIDKYPHDYDAAWGIARIYCLEVHIPSKCLAWTDRLLAAYPHEKKYRRAAAQGWKDQADSERAAGDEAAARQAEDKANELER